MAGTYFISDAHLGSDSVKKEIAKEQKLIRFLDFVAQNGERLFIVGDLFDFWFEYRTVVPRGYTRILCALNRLNELGIELHYIAGNHDFWMRDYLEKEFNFTIHFDEVDWHHNNKRFYIFHGDGLAKDDSGYRFLKKIFRNRFNIFLYSLLHPDLGIPLAKWVSALSRQHTRQGAPPADDDYIARAMKKFEEGYDFAIFGHLHSPRFQKFGQKIYLNLGDWIDHFSYAEYEDRELKLLTWK